MAASLETERERTVQQAIEELYLDCVHCGMCQSACPTYDLLGTEMDSPRGRIYLIRALAEGRLPLSPAILQHLNLCLGCRGCETDCPSSVYSARLLEEARAELLHVRRSDAANLFLRGVVRWIMPNSLLFALAVAPARVLRKLLPAWVGARGKPLDGSVRGFRRLLAMLPDDSPASPEPATITPAVGERRSRVGILTGCVQPVLFPGVNLSTARLLAHLGHEVHAPRAQVCCGAISSHDGDLEGARRLARKNLQVFEALGLDTIVVNAPGCAAMMKDYGWLLRNDPQYAQRAARFAAKVRDLSEFVAAGPLPEPVDKFPHLVTYHEPCQLAHGQKIRKQPRQLLNAVPGLRLLEMRQSDRCCGGAGSYTLLQPETSDLLLRAKLQNAAETRAEMIVTSNPPCLLQIGMGLRRTQSGQRLVHLVEVLEKAFVGPISPPAKAK